MSICDLESRIVTSNDVSEISKKRLEKAVHKRTLDYIKQSKKFVRDEIRAYHDANNPRIYGIIYDKR